jgi:hypothetical protein
MSKQENFIEWLSRGVKHSIITENYARKLYEQRYAPVSKERFAEIIYEEL